MEELFGRDSFVSIHMRNMQTLAIEMLKVVNDISPEIMKEVFKICDENRPCFRQQIIFRISLVNSIYNGIETVKSNI